MTRPARLLGAALALVLGTLLASALPAAADAGDPPLDPGPDWTLVSTREDTTTAPAAACGPAREWVWSSGEQELTLYAVPCTDEEAAGGLWEWLGIGGAVVPGATEESELVLWREDSVLRAWTYDGGGSSFGLVVLTVTCAGASRDACVADSAGLALDALDAFPGGRGGAATPGMSVQSMVLTLVVPVLIIAAIVAPFRLVSTLARARYTSASTSPRYHDVTATVRRARRRRRIRRGLWWLVAALAFIGVAAFTTRNDNQMLGSLMFIVPPAAVVLAGTRSFLEPHPVERGRRGLQGLGAQAAVGTVLSVLAVALAVLVLLLHMLVSTYGLMSLGWPSLTDADLARMDLPLLPGLAPLAVSLGADAHVVATILALAALAVAALVDGLGQRLRSASIDEALAQDDRPHYLYLRSFDEDRLTLTGQLRRRGLVSALALRRRVRFEEVMVRQLSATGPVIAIAPPGSNLPAIGAARASFSNDEWQHHVTRYAETARAVVLSATPGEIRAGYGWELDLIANRITHQRVLVVLAPWRLSQLRRRWTQFCMAVSHVPLFAPITMPWVPDGVHVIAHSARLGWHAWGATRRTDWTYAVAIDEATRAYLPEWS